MFYCESDLESTLGVCLLVFFIPLAPMIWVGDSVWVGRTSDLGLSPLYQHAVTVGVRWGTVRYQPLWSTVIVRYWISSDTFAPKQPVGCGVAFECEGQDRGRTWCWSMILENKVIPGWFCNWCGPLCLNGLKAYVLGINRLINRPKSSYRTGGGSFACLDPRCRAVVSFNLLVAVALTQDSMGWCDLVPIS